jgi:hypothetical protein
MEPPAPPLRELVEHEIVVLATRDVAWTQWLKILIPKETSKGWYAGPDGLKPNIRKLIPPKRLPAGTMGVYELGVSHDVITQKIVCLYVGHADGGACDLRKVRCSKLRLAQIYGSYGVGAVWYLSEWVTICEAATLLQPYFMVCDIFCREVARFLLDGQLSVKMESRLKKRLCCRGSTTPLTCI